MHNSDKTYTVILFQYGSLFIDDQEHENIAVIFDPANTEKYCRQWESSILILMG